MEDRPGSVIYTVDGNNKFRQLASRLQNSRYVILAIHRDVDAICDLLGCVRNVQCKKKAKKIFVLDFLTLEDWINMSRNVGTKLPL